METIDLTERTTDSLFEEVVAALADNQALTAADELRRRCQEANELFYLPLAVEAKIKDTYGTGRQTFDAMTRRIRFCFKVWQGKYGPFTPDQAAYAEELALWALGAADEAKEAGEKRAKVLYRLDRLVNHESTDAGFKRRAQTVDITVELSEALA